MTSPANLFLRALFRCHLRASSLLLPIRAYRRDFQSVLRLAPLQSSTPYRGLDASYIVSRVGRVVRHPWMMRNRRCLREGLLGHRFLQLAGFDPELHFGVDPKSARAENLSAHCWISLNGKSVVSQSLPGMVEIYCHKKPRG